MAGKRGAGKGDLPPPLPAEPQLRGQHQVRGRQHGGDGLCCHSQHKVCRDQNFTSIREIGCRITNKCHHLATIPSIFPTKYLLFLPLSF